MAYSVHGILFLQQILLPRSKGFASSEQGDIPWQVHSQIQRYSCRSYHDADVLRSCFAAERYGRNFRILYDGVHLDTHIFR